MQTHKCLFCESNNCNDIASKEHIIQEGLGGTLASPSIVCGNCNNYFSQNLDSHLINLYDPIIKIISPLLSGRLKYKKRESKLTTSDTEQYDIKYSGGTANLSKIVHKRNPNGQHEIIAPSSYPREKLEEIAGKKGAKGVKIFKKIPLTEYFPDARERICLNVNTSVIRAILLDILELIQYVHDKKKSFANIAKHHSLNELRLWIRTGHPSAPSFLKDTFPWCAPISDLLDPLFEPSTFSHRLVICFDYETKSFILIAQFANTMPWLFIFEDTVVHSSSFSILYKKALVDGVDQLIDKAYPVLNIHDLRWCKFSTNTKDAIKFAQTKWKQDFEIQNARAHYEFDLREDNHINEKLIYYRDNCCNKETAPVEAIVQLMQNRYELNQNLKSILETTRKKANKLWANSIDEQEIPMVSVYRECLRGIKDKFGYPDIS